MKCPFCGDQESKVVDSRRSEDGQSIRRRRECLKCQRRFTTYEMVESLPIIVIKRDGTRQNFDRNKILNSMIRAFDKRKVDLDDLDRITTEIEQAIQNSLEREISTDRLGENGDGADQAHGRGGIYPFCIGIPPFPGCQQFCPGSEPFPGGKIRSPYDY